MLCTVSQVETNISEKFSALILIILYSKLSPCYHLISAME
jgi:hypothetical protein